MKTAIYKTFDNIENFKIRIKLKEIRSGMYLTDEISLNSANTESEHVEIEWQQKLFNRDEISKYNDLSKCETELEKKYNKIITDKEYLSHKMIFTYVDEDNYNPTSQNLGEVDEIEKKLECMCIKNSKDELKPSEKYISMHIMADFHTDDSEETSLSKIYTVCTIKWYPQSHNLVITPDFSSTKAQSYKIEVDNDTLYASHYWIENCSKDVNDLVRFREFELLKNLNKRKRQIQKQNLQESDFHIPATDEINVHLFLEISIAKDFESDNVFVQYFIDLPNHWKVLEEFGGELSGVTYCTKARLTENFENVFYIGFPIELALSYNLKKLSPERGILESPVIYFEIVSKDSWSRYRTEGYTYKILPINNLTLQNYTLQCLRVTDSSPFGKLQDFFIGGCSILDNITWLAIPNESKESKCINKFGIQTEGTGTLEIKVQVLQHSKSFINQSQESQKSNVDLLYATSLVKSVNEVLRAFKQARHKMNIARQKLLQ